MTIIVSLSFFFYLIVPYCLGLLTSRKTTIYSHICTWVICNLVFAVIFSIKESDIITVPLLILACGLCYYLFTYLFYGRKLLVETKTDNYKTLISSSIFSAIIKVILILSLLFIVAVSIFCICTTKDMYYIIYFVVTILLQWIESLIYSKKIYKIADNKQ